tara:strand:+ start:614 stop:1177 length:564 start_codon:yes stop_codon:yes gene_type:complete
MPSILQLKFTTLIRKLSFLKSDLEYHRAEHNKRKEIFYDDLNSYIANSKYQYSESKAEKNFVYPYKSTRAVEPPELERESKEIFRKVAKSTHPDVDKEKRHTQKFMKAKAAFDAGDWFTLYELVQEFETIVLDITDAHLKWMKQEIDMMEKMIKNITTTYEWVYSNEGANKQHLLTTYCMLTCKLKE